MAYSIIRAKALEFLRMHGVDDPTTYKMSEIAFGCGALVLEKPLAKSEGRIVFGRRDTIITVNKNISTTQKKRFVLAHELGHFAMHRDHFEVHGDTDQTLDYFQNGPQEREANEFAAEILMPWHQFRAACSGKRMGPELIRSLAEDFQVSVTAAAYRFAEIGNHPLMIVYCQSGRVMYYKKSEDFELWPLNLARLPVPVHSVAYEYFTNQARYSKGNGRQEVRRSTWFHLKDDEADAFLYEFCIPNSWNNSAISVIWED